jgi:hypothetical protein
LPTVNIARRSARKIFRFYVADASRVERCYEPANAEFVVAIPDTDATGQTIDHDFVINALGRNNLKN